MAASSVHTHSPAWTRRRASERPSRRRCGEQGFRVLHPASQPLLFLLVIFTGLGAGGACPQERKKAHPHPSPHRLPAAAAFPGPYPTLAGKSLVPGGLRQPSIHPFVRSFHHSIDYGWCDMYRWKPSIVSGWLVSRRISISKVMDSFTTLPSSFLPLLSFLFHTYIHTYIHTCYIVRLVLLIHSLPC